MVGVGEAVSYLLLRNGKFLSEVYQWGDTPNAFPEWQFPQVLEQAMQYKDRPLEVGELIGGDLDNVKWTKLD